ncbi:MAG TPA: hypothetical protein ENF26_03590 [Methanomicrobia archaeon]|nr:hypothetical protein [Methanomicrobia archaeon]HEX59214.1 hypothetical protein [Methanomicrobia archaeon]
MAAVLVVVTLALVSGALPHRLHSERRLTKNPRKSENRPRGEPPRPDRRTGFGVRRLPPRHTPLGSELTLPTAAAAVSI